MRKSKAAPAGRQRAETAFEQLLDALGVAPGVEIRQAAKRAAALWLDHLVAGERANLAKILGPGMARHGRTPVLVTDVGVHLVCPHHLTVAFGVAHLAYVPHGRVVGLGSLAELATACTARFVLQEDATQDVCDALVEHLGATAAVAVIDAQHPCHNITHPRSHAARAVTAAMAGDEAAAKRLERLLLPAIGRVGRRRPA